MKANKSLKRAGPYKVISISQDLQGVRLVVYPAFLGYGKEWEISRLKGEGGGPGIFAVLALADTLERFLNQCYTETEIAAWKNTLDEALKDIQAKDRKRLERAIKRELEKDRILK